MTEFKIIGYNNDRPSVIDEITCSATGAMLMPRGISDERPQSAVEGMLRYNTSVSLMEFYNGTTWISITTPSPKIDNIFPTKATQPNFDISINGSNFDISPLVQFIGNDGTIYTSPQVTFINSSQVIAKTPSIALSISNETYDVKIINSSGLEYSLLDSLSAGGTPIFNTSSGSLGTIYDLFRNNGTYIIQDISATDPDGDTVTYDICGGSLPTGLSLDQSTGVISGNANAVANITTYTFTVGAITSNATTTRSFNITVYPPQTFTYNFNADSYEQHFNIPSGLPGITVKMWGAGGGQYHANQYGDVDGTGGPGGYSQSTINFLSGETTLTLVVGQGGSHNATGGYGGGGAGYNGGAGAGGGSFIFSGQLTNTFAFTSPGGTITSEPQSVITNLDGASGVIMVAGGGGGAGWYNTYDANGGLGGGIEGSSGNSPNHNTDGGTQSTGGTGGGTGTGAGQGLGTNGGYLQGGYISYNSSSGGSGGGGGGWYGGGAWQGDSGFNAGGGGGSGFVGFTNGTSPNAGTSGTLTENTSGTPIGYTDNITRTNGSRTYTNSLTLRTGNQTSGNGIFAPPYINDPDYPGSKIGYGGEQTLNNNTLGENGKNGAIVIKY